MLTRMTRSTVYASRAATQPMVLRLNSTAAHVYKEDPSKSAMLRFQDSLPKLPVPTLEETAVRYLRSVKAVASSEQYNHTEQAVKAFLKGPGPTLQQRLEERARDPTQRNWLAQWWTDGAYLTYRDPVVPYVSYFYSHKDDVRFKNQPAKKAAYITTAALSFKQQVDNGTLEPEYMRKEPICMDAYQYMFNVCRIPKPERDEAKFYDKASNRHFVAMRKNRVFKIDHVDSNGNQLSTADFEKAFKAVYALVDQDGKQGPAIGALTSQNRDVWAEAYERLVEVNGESVAAIEGASFVVCLDDASPVTLEERAHQYWHGDGQNRYYDKPLNFIVCDNGISGFMGEHSMMDGTQTHRLNTYVCQSIVEDTLDFGASETGSTVEPQELSFKVTPEINTDITRAIEHFRSQIGQHELKVFVYKGYGKNAIKQFKCSPDAYVQMMLQLAYYKMHGVCRPTYESAATRKFQLGRTETCRSVSLESVAFCEAMEDPARTHKERESALRAALQSHTKYIADASEGHGVDRHLFGLKKLLQPGEPVPELYQDPMFTYSSSWFISSSQLSSDLYNGYGWSQVIDQGFGLAYMINSNSIQVNIVSKKQGSDRMRYYLEQAADDMAALFEAKAKL